MGSGGDGGVCPFTLSWPLIYHAFLTAMLLLITSAQGVLLDIYILANDQTASLNYFWLLPDFLMVFPFVFAMSGGYRKSKNLKYASCGQDSQTPGTRHGTLHTPSSSPTQECPQPSPSYRGMKKRTASITSTQDRTSTVRRISKLFGPRAEPVYVWFAYTSLMVAKIAVIFRSEIPNKISPDGFLSPTLLQVTISMSALVFGLLVEGQSGWWCGMDRKGNQRKGTGKMDKDRKQGGNSDWNTETRDETGCSETGNHGTDARSRTGKWDSEMGREQDGSGTPKHRRDASTGQDSPYSKMDVYIYTESQAKERERDRETYIRVLTQGTALETLDTVTFLSLLIQSDTGLVLPLNLELLILSLACINLFLPGLTLFKLSHSNYGSERLNRVLPIVYKLTHLWLTNVSFMVIRVYLWAGLSVAVSPFVVKNLYHIFAVLRSVYTDAVEVFGSPRGICQCLQGLCARRKGYKAKDEVVEMSVGKDGFEEIDLGVSDRV